MSEPAIVALTPNGLTLGRRLAQALGRGEVLTAQGAAYNTLAPLFRAGRPLVCIMALGIVVRIVGPLTRDKMNEPAVIVVDEGGRFAVSVLGGHQAQANELAEEVARALGAVAVITTASDSLGLVAVDQIGRTLGWRIEDKQHLTTVAAAVVRGTRIAVYQDAGRRDWWKRFGDWPMNFERVAAWPDDSWEGALVITDRAVPALDCPHVIYRPRSLVFGVGCKRGVPEARIEAMFQELCRTHRLSPLSLGVVASATLKADEVGLLAFARRHDAKPRFFAKDELEMITDLPTPSAKVHAKIGVFGVAEPAALLAALSPDLLVTKQRGDGITMAVAQREDA